MDIYTLENVCHTARLHSEKKKEQKLIKNEWETTNIHFSSPYEFMIQFKSNIFMSLFKTIQGSHTIWSIHSHY